MPIYAQLQDGRCVALTEAGGPLVGDHLIERPAYDPSEVGKRYDAATGRFVAVDEPSPSHVPEECTPAQGLVALFALRQITETQLDAAVAQIADPALRYTAQIGLKRTTTWRRHSPTTQQLAQLLALTEADLDALFTFAIGVEL